MRRGKRCGGARSAARTYHLELCGGFVEDELAARVYGERGCEPERHKPVPDFAKMAIEQRKPCVTFALLHAEDREAEPEGYAYAQFCTLYREYSKRHRLTMRQEHRAGESMFVDYAGTTPRIIDRETGQEIPVQLFVAVLGASNYTHAEATMTQSGPDFIASHLHAYQYFGGVAKQTIPDQLRSGVSRPCYYEPGIQRAYEEMGMHLGTTVFPARPYHPRDKAKVEVGVQIVERWIVACLRNRQFFSSRLSEELRVASGDGTYARFLAKLARIDILRLDDWGHAPFKEQERRDWSKFSMTDTEHGRRSSRANHRPHAGTNTSATRPMLTHSATEFCIKPTRSCCRENRNERKQRRLFTELK